MKANWEKLEGGVLGLLVGDALGVPYEFHTPQEIPSAEDIEMLPPQGFPRSYSHVPAGTWSDDGAQALCLLDSLLACGGWDPADFAARLLDWSRKGRLAVDGIVFDIGIQTGAALARLADGVPPLEAGLGGERNNGNGSLMRTLPLALLHAGDEASLVTIAHEQSRVTHAHPCSQVCCALYALWARNEIAASPAPWSKAVETLRTLYPPGTEHRLELESRVLPYPDGHPLRGTGYVLDCLHSARAACQGSDYATIIRTAVAMGHDTDTTACVAGGIAGIRHGKSGIPAGWLSALRGREILDPLLRGLASATTSVR